MLVNTLTYKKSNINYYRFGRGKSLTICLHGYGETGNNFAFLKEYLSKERSFIAIDLPFHGLTNWQEGLNMDSADLMRIVKAILQAQHIPDTQKLTLLGFSLGGRIACCLYQLMPERIEKIILLAPDGLKVNGWYWLSTQTRLGNQLFRFTMKRPGLFLGLLKILNRLGLINASIYKFVIHYIKNKQVREDLYHRWTGFRNIKPDIPAIRRLIQEFDTDISLVYGQFDRIILPDRGVAFQKGIEDRCSLLVIPSGHQVLHERNMAALRPVLMP